MVGAIVVGTIIIVILVAIIMAFIATEYNSYRRQKEYTPIIERVTTELGDEFGVNIETVDFPDITNFIDILDTTNNDERIALLCNEGEFKGSPFVTVLNTPEIRCYQYSDDLLIYKIADGKFESLDIRIIDTAKPEEQPSFIKVAQALVAKKEWKWVRICGKFLLQAGDDNMRQTFERYAAGEFTPEELEINKDSGFGEIGMMLFSKEIIEGK